MLVPRCCHRPARLAGSLVCLLTSLACAAWDDTRFQAAYELANSPTQLAWPPPTPPLPAATAWPNQPGPWLPASSATPAASTGPQPVAQALGRRCRQSGGRWQAPWLACRCPANQAFGPHGCASPPPKVALAPHCPPERAGWSASCASHLSDGSCQGAAAAADCAPGLGPHNVWHLGRAGAQSRRLAARLDQNGPLLAPPNALEVAGSAALTLVYMDVAAQQRWWPQTSAQPPLPAADLGVAAALWAAEPARGARLERSCLRLLGRLATKRSSQRSQRRAVCAAVVDLSEQANGHGPGAYLHNKRPLQALQGFAAARPPQLPAWQLRANLVGPGPGSKPLGRWQVTGVAEAVLQRRLQVDAPGFAPLFVFFAGDGGVVGFAADVGQTSVVWYDADARAVAAVKNPEPPLSF